MKTISAEGLLFWNIFHFFTPDIKGMIQNTNTIWLPWWGLLSKK